MKNKLVVLGLLFTITCSGKVYSTEDDMLDYLDKTVVHCSTSNYNEINGSNNNFENLKKAVIKLNVKPYSKVNGKLPYKFSKREINSVIGSQERMPLEMWYTLVKYTFNILTKKIEEVEKYFKSEDDDKELTNKCIKIIIDYLNNKDSDENFNKDEVANEIKWFFDSACSNIRGSLYIRDIIRSNIYSAVISYWVKQNNTTLDNTNAKHNFYNVEVSNIKSKIGVNDIKNEIRRNITEDLFDHYYLHKDLPILCSKANDKLIYRYLARIVGLQQDIYNDFTNNLLILGIDFETYKLIQKIMNVDDEYMFNNFYPLVSRGFITDPYIVYIMLGRKCPRHKKVDLIEVFKERYQIDRIGKDNNYLYI